MSQQNKLANLGSEYKLWATADKVRGHSGEMEIPEAIAEGVKA